MKIDDFPADFDVRTDPVFQGRIRPFIDAQLAALKALDERRAAWVRDNLPPDYQMTYFFHGHTLRVADDMKKTAAYLGLPDAACENLYQAMLLHDIGKTQLPLDLWDMVEKPEDDIKAARRAHTDLGAQMLRAAFDVEHPFLDLAEDIILNHHEQMDGGGYRGLTGDALSAPVRLACIVESFDGYRIKRPHFGDRDVSDRGVLERMKTEKGADFYDMELLEAFAKMKLKEE